MYIMFQLTEHYCNRYIHAFYIRNQFIRNLGYFARKLQKLLKLYGSIWFTLRNLLRKCTEKLGLKGRFTPIPFIFR